MSDRSASRSRSVSHSRSRSPIRMSRSASRSPVKRSVTPSKSPKRSRSRTPRRSRSRSPRRSRSPPRRTYSRSRTPEESKSVMIRNLSFDTTTDDIRHEFSHFGELLDVYLPRDHYSGRPRGFGFIEFADVRDAMEAVKGLDGETIAGREVQVTVAKQRRKTARDFNRSRGGYGGGGRRDYGGRGRDNGGRGRDNYYRRSRSRSRGRRYNSRSRSRGRY